MKRDKFPTGNTKMKKYSMWYIFLYWNFDCDQDKVVFQLLRILKWLKEDKGKGVQNESNNGI